MLIQTAPADTLDFMLLGFGVILGAIGLFILSLAVRLRNVRRDAQLLEDLEAEAGR